jgi:hypothetical protein
VIVMTTTTTKATNRLVSAEERERLQTELLPVYCHCGGRARPQDAYIVIDPERDEGQVYAEYSHEPGSAVTLRHFYGREAHIKLSPYAYGPDILAFIDSHANELLAIIEDYRCVWDGRDGELVGRWGETACRLLPRLWWAARCNIRVIDDEGRCVHA